MERNYDEIIAEILIEMDQPRLQGEKLNRKLASNIKRMDLTVRRMVKAEERLEKLNEMVE